MDSSRDCGGMERLRSTTATTVPLRVGIKSIGPHIAITIKSVNAIRKAVKKRDGIFHVTHAQSKGIRSKNQTGC